MDTRHQVLLVNSFHNPTVEALREQFIVHELEPVSPDKRARFIKDLSGCRIAATASWDCDATVYQLQGLELIAAFGVGVDGIDFQQTGRLGIQVSNTPDVLTEAVADLAIGLLLNLSRDIAGAERFLRAGQWQSGAYPFGRGIQGLTLGIAGYGRIGAAIAKRALSMGLHIAYHSRRKKEGGFAYHTSLRSLAENSDILVNVLPGGPETAHAIDAEVLQALGPKGLFINVGRGSSVDEPALAAALQNGVIAGAGLDVFEHEPKVHPDLLNSPRVVMTPHIGSATVETRQAMGDLVLENIRAFLDGRPLLTPVM